MSECNHDCSSCAQKCDSAVDFRKNLHEGAKVRKVIAVVSGKGGVGKSLVTCMLASEMQSRGFRAAVLDADITRPSVPKSFGISEHAVGGGDFLYPVISNGGTQLMSINLILDDETQPVVWRGGHRRGPDRLHLRRKGPPLCQSDCGSIRIWHRKETTTRYWA